MNEVRNARITKTMLGYEDHGILTCYLHLDYGGSGQAFGGYSLDEPARDEEGYFKGRVGTAYGMEFIARILGTLEVESWERLPGTPIRVECGPSLIVAVGHYIKDKWLRPADMKAEFYPEVVE